MFNVVLNHKFVQLIDSEETNSGIKTQTKQSPDWSNFQWSLATLQTRLQTISQIFFKKKTG